MAKAVEALIGLAVAPGWDARDQRLADVVPGASIRIYGNVGKRAYDLTFKVGDTAVCGSYNLIYTGEITKIGPKTVTIVEHKGHPLETTHRLKFAEFSWRNDNYDTKRIAEQNLETSYCI
jgi:hypothetical protein